MSSDFSERPAFRDPFPIFRVADVSRSLAFYCDGLGFTVGYRWPADGEPNFVVVALDGKEIGPPTWSEGQSDDTADATKASIEVYLLVDDMEAASAWLRQCGAPELLPPMRELWNEYIALFAAPDGITFT